MSEQPYQLFNALPDEQYQALKADIAKRGVLVAVEFDENGELLDGHHRVRACKELGITEFPRVVRTDLDEAAKREHVLKLNLLRRHLGPVAWTEAFARLAELRGVRLGEQGRQKAKTATVAVLAAEVGVSERTARRRLQEAKALTAHADLAAQTDAGDLEVKRALRIVRDREAASRRERLQEEFAARSKERLEAGDERADDLWTSARRWLTSKADRIAQPVKQGNDYWATDPLPLATGTAKTAHMGATKLIPDEVLDDPFAMHAIEKARASYADLVREFHERSAALNQWVNQQRAAIAAHLTEAANLLPDDPTILAARSYVSGNGGSFVNADLRNCGVMAWSSPHSTEGCACGDATPLGCLPSTVDGAP